jgi:hypothetical protein
MICWIIWCNNLLKDPNYKEREYGTDSNKPNFLLAYALKKLPENEALKFKSVENFNESSKGLVDFIQVYLW